MNFASAVGDFLCSAINFMQAILFSPGVFFLSPTVEDSRAFFGETGSRKNFPSLRVRDLARRKRQALGVSGSLNAD